MPRKILLGLSGGVDSAVCALLLKNAGYEVCGCHIFFSGDADENSADCADAKKVAEQTGIDFVCADCREEFRKNVEEYFIKEYLSGKTPSPCIICNPTTKFAALIKEADRLGCSLIATGHYARIDRSAGSARLAAADSKKDQSYFLYRLPQSIVERTVFPLENYSSKDEIRSFALENGLEISGKKDSLEICFIPDDDYRSYILSKTKKIPGPGDFVDINGKVIGRHTGIMNYTIGQRKGLGAFGEKKFVKAINPAENTVTLCNAGERFARSLSADRLVFENGTPDENRIYGVKIRSAASPAPARISVEGDVMKVDFLSDVLAPCPGQSAVVYGEDGTVIGGGIII